MGQSVFTYVSYIRASAESIWTALTTRALSEQYWFGMHMQTDWKPGSAWKMIFADGELADSGVVQINEPGRKLVLRWLNEWKPEMRAEGESVCTIELEPSEVAVKLSIRHEMPVDNSLLIAAVSGGWPRIISNLKTLLETGGLHASGTAAAAARSMADSDTVLATVLIPASAERIWQALTTKEVEQWWGSPDTYSVNEWQADLREGGQWSLVVKANGQDHPASGRFLTLQHPTRLVQTRRYDWDFPELGRRDTTVTFSLERQGGSTRVTVRHDGFCGIKAAAEQHAGGWIRFLDWLSAFCCRESA